MDMLLLAFLTASTGTTAAQKAARPISDEEEYYVGRAVAARILSTYPLVKNKKLTEYVNTIGMLLSLHSEKPYTHGGYHFAILDTNEMNAFACPGGIIFITKGMLKATSNEEELAAVLAHEIAHVNHRDGISSIKKSRWTEAVTIIGAKATENYGPKELSKLTSIFEGSIDDIVKTLVVNGYGKSQEYSADKTALTFLAKTGYNAAALKDFLEKQGSSKASEGGIMKTHPGTADRIDNIKGDLPSAGCDPSLIKKRTDRFVISCQ
jgi:predicted Zn-dependent protease